MKTVYLFTMPEPHCQRCMELKQLLNDNSITFTELTVPPHGDLWSQIKGQLPGVRIFFPTVFIQEDDGGNGYIFAPGRDFYTPEQALDIVKNNI